MTRDHAWAIVEKYVKNENLRKHMLAVEAAMAKYYEYFASGGLDKVATKGSYLASWSASTPAKSDPTGFGRTSEFFKEKNSGSSEEDWRVVGLLHDFDWEIHPTLEEHPQKGEAILEKEGLPKQLRHAILSHAEHLRIPRETLMEKTLFAVDELTGLIVAVALMKGRKLENVRIESVLKKWKQKSFAKGVSREDIERGAADVGVPLEEHIQIVLRAMKSIAGNLGL